ncbi:BZ3500_MvSof-1268-A1-R1_Chr1-3g02453 [Microbotryum saponariae]|uniref:BZ3500_MvSof-1268-A1-R1_Chr1-3g02453 protein n=1 Tax=Microbotryum saponariae TaxID=289078 RepID=A0A2X0MA57_9BASI|nr:BZ3500_MvSof-1268-A1-R1_Chr1-3g02453 [Microbotryum saponariae]SCZ96274.1 BZ3501_MvSof-1269-A2-R1_Chr1-3g02056 [Microbotryum saponariae]
MQSLLPKMKVPKLPSFLKRKNTSTSQRAREPSTPLLITSHSPFNQPESRINTTQTTNNRFTESPKRSRSDEGASPTSTTRSLRSTSTSSTSSYHELSESFTSLHLHREIPIEDNPNPFLSPRPNILDTTRHPVRSEGCNISQIVKAPFVEPAMDGRDRLRGMRLMVGEAKVKEGEAKRMLKQSREAVKGLKKDLKKVAREEKIEKKKQKKADKTKAKGKGKGMP